jgi:hypothetical protein
MLFNISTFVSHQINKPIKLPVTVLSEKIIFLVLGCVGDGSVWTDV